MMDRVDSLVQQDTQFEMSNIGWKSVAKIAKYNQLC